LEKGISLSASQALETSPKEVSMDGRAVWRERLRFFLLGMLVVIGFLMLPGGVANTPPLNSGRYQLSAWSGALGPQGGGVGAFVIDTVSGEVRTAYSRIYGAPGEGDLIKNNLNKPFSAMN
jgi:hypothetical protein